MKFEALPATQVRKKCTNQVLSHQTRLKSEEYHPWNKDGTNLSNHEPTFDQANLIRSSRFQPTSSSSMSHQALRDTTAVVVVVVVVGIGRQPAPHRSEVVETPLLSDSGVYTPNMTRESSQPPNQVIETPQGALTLHVQHCTPKAHSVVHLQVKGMGRPCHRLRM